MKKNISALLFVFLSPLLFITFATETQGGIPNVSGITVTDVSTRSFSVIWQADEPGFADLLVYDDEAGATIDEYAKIHPHLIQNGDAAIVEAAENNGVMKVTVTGLLPDTTYYFQTVTTSKSTGEINRFPQTAPLPGVTTERFSSRTILYNEKKTAYSNDILVHECYLPDTITPAAGTLLVVEVEEGKHPVSAFVGDGLPAPFAAVDLNNIFPKPKFPEDYAAFADSFGIPACSGSSCSWDTDDDGDIDGKDLASFILDWSRSGRNIFLAGWEPVTVTQFMGIYGKKQDHLFVPENFRQAEFKKASVTHPCKWDENGDGDVDGADLALFAADRNDFTEADFGGFVAEFGDTRCLVSHQ